jgi:tripartite ATP-independent transporter DctM subunit
MSKYTPSRLIWLAIGLAIAIAMGVYTSWSIAVLMVLFVSGVPLFTVMIGAAILGALWLVKTGVASGVRPDDTFDAEFDGMVADILRVGLGDQVQVMSTIPLFIYAGYLLAEAKTADRLVRFANAALGWVPGGLAIVTIGTCALFTVFTGASGVTIIALGGVLMPALVKNGYPERFSMGLIAGTGSVGLLFPPALPLFVYGTVYGLTRLEPELWDTRRFLFAGIVPGMVLIGMLSAVAVSVAVIKKLPRQRFEFGELARSFLVALPELVIPFGVIGLLGVGFGLPEVAALTVVYTILLEVGALRMLKLKQLWTTSHEAMAMVGAIFIIIFGSTVLTNFMITAEVPQKLVAWTQAHVESKIVFLLAINVLLLIVGTVMDIFSAIVVVLPLIGPIAKAYGIDPYNLGVIFLLNLEVGYLHPPVGLNLFITSVKFRRPITEVMWATIPFLITMIVALLTITYVPQLTIVPDPERTGPARTLVSIVQVGHEEARVSIKDITLVDSAGAPLSDARGKPLQRRFKDCLQYKTEAELAICKKDKADRDKTPEAFKDKPRDPRCEITDETRQTTCQQLFFDVTDCVPDPKQKTDNQTDCANRAIAKWTVKELNSEAAADTENAVIVVTEVPIVDSDGKPVLDKDAPVVKKLASCDKDKAGKPRTGTERDNCRYLFMRVSSCRISPDKLDDCIAERTKACTENDGACVKDKSAACRKDKTEQCERDKIAEWYGDFADEAKR